MYTWMLAVGVSHQQLRDDALGELRWQGPAGALALGWARDGQRLDQTFALELGGGAVLNRYGHPGIVLASRVDYGLFAPPLAIGAGTLSLGGMATWELDDQYIFSWDLEHLYWINAWQIGPRVRWSGQIARHAVGVELGAPVAALASRAPEFRFVKIGELNRPLYHLAEPQRYLELATWNRYQAFDLELTGALTRGTALTWTAQYRGIARPVRADLLAFSLAFEKRWPQGGAR
jgi:hypothetical protein